MLVITPRLGFSNYLQAKNPNIDIKNIHLEILDSAKKIVLNNTDLSSFLNSFSINIENISMIAQESGEDFYYISYVENSLIDIVFDIDVTEILEIVISPKTLKRKPKVEEQDGYTEVINKFLQNISPSWDMQSYIKNSGNDIYFIDMKTGNFLHTKYNMELLTNALKEIDNAIDTVVYIKEPNDFKIITQTVSENKNTSSKNEPIEPFSKIKNDKKLVIELRNTQHLSFEQKNAVSILCNIALSLFDE